MELSQKTVSVHSFWSSICLTKSVCLHDRLDMPLKYTLIKYIINFRVKWIIYSEYILNVPEVLRFGYPQPCWRNTVHGELVLPLTSLVNHPYIYQLLLQISIISSANVICVKTSQQF